MCVCVCVRVCVCVCTCVCMCTVLYQLPCYTVLHSLLFCIRWPFKTSLDLPHFALHCIPLTVWDCSRMMFTCDVLHWIPLKWLCLHVTAQVTYASGDLRVSGGGLSSEYGVVQFHFHWGSSDQQGSEHTIDGVPYPMEVSHRDVT